eukprot:609116_1
MSVNSYTPRSKHFKIGDYVILKNREGYIRYIGKREHHHGTWYGIELFVGQGPNDGSEHGKRYFACKQRHGIFVRLYAIKSKLEPRPIDPRKLKGKAQGRLPLLPQSQTLSEADRDCSISTTSSMRTPSPKAVKVHTQRPTHKSKTQYYHNLRVEDRPESTRGSTKSPWQKPPPCRPKSARMSKTNATKSGKTSSFQLSSPRLPPSSPRRPIKRSVKRSPRVDYTSDHSHASTDIMDLSSSAPSSAADTSDSDDITVRLPKARMSKESRNRTLSMNRARSSDRKSNTKARTYRTLSMNKAHSSDKPKIKRKKPPKRSAKKDKKKGKPKRKQVRNVSRVRTQSDTHDQQQAFGYKKRTKSTPQKRQKKVAKVTKKAKKGPTRTIKVYNKRSSYQHRPQKRRSKTMDLGQAAKMKEMFENMEGRSSTEEETSSSDETEDDMDMDEDMGRTIALPSLKNAHSTDAGKYTFRLHIKKDEEDGQNKEKEYRLILPDEEEEIPLRLRQSYSLRSSHHNDDIEADEDEYYEAERSRGTTRSNTLTTDFSEALWNANNNEHDGLDGVGFTSMRPPELSDDLMFISQNNVSEFDIRRHHVMGTCFEIEESVIEYHVPSMTKQNRNKNIKINIHINNDVNSKKKKGNKMVPNKLNTSSKQQKHVSGNASVGSAASMMKKKKKKHKHHHKSRHKSKKNCSCHKHNKEKKKEKKKKKKENSIKKSKPQIKFRPKLPRKSKTPRVRGSAHAPPPPPISPRNGSRYKRGAHGYDNVRRFGWNGLV